MIVDDKDEVVVGKKRKLDEMGSEPIAKKFKVSDTATNGSVDDELIILE